MCLCAFSRSSVPSSNSGVALIMVLGLLTVMMILAVTFAVSMRTERLAAGNAADNVRARELVQVGLARALDQLVADLGSGLPGGKVYPDWNVKPSYTNIGGGEARFVANDYQNLLLVKGEATNYIPRALWDAATNADLRNPSNHWLAVENIVITNVGGIGGTNYIVESNLFGRVAYLIINCSGLVDANYAGGVPRQSGTNPNEIAVWGETNTGFITNRIARARCETMKELNAFGGINSPVTNLFVYSRALPGYWSNNVAVPANSRVVPQVNLSGTEQNIYARQAEITNALVNIGFSESEARVIYRNLLDYIDSDPKPTNSHTSVESVPMINEVVVSNNVAVANSGSGTTGNKNYTIKPTVYVECWYPFVSNSSGSFDLNGSVTFSAPGIFSSSGPFTFSVPLGTFLPGGFPVKICYSPPPSTPYDVARVNTVKLISEISLSVICGAVTVDEVSIPVTLTNENDGANNYPDYITYASAECRDPRFNWNPNDANQWGKQTGATALHTLGRINAWPGGLFPSGSDGDEKMFVANRPLQSVAELGYLVYSSNAPWCTIKLYGPNRHRVLDVFGLSPNAGDTFITDTTVYRGLVNCNTNVASNATAAVFADMPVDQYPGGPSVRLDMEQARSIATNIFHGGICTNLSDIGRALTNFPVGATELERESYFRNAFNLLNLRQNMFMIIIEAHSASGGNIPKNPARQRAVAIVWRDPYTGEMFVRHIKWLGD